MVARNTMRKKMLKLQQESAKVEQNGLSAGAVFTLINCGIHFLLGAVFSGATIFTTFQPFGVCLVAGAGSGLCAASALFGAGFGYLSTLGFTEGLRYLAAAVLTFSISFAFGDSSFVYRPWVMPSIAAAMNAVTGFVALSKLGWNGQEVVFFFGEILITALGGWTCHAVLCPMRQPRGGESYLHAVQQTASFLFSILIVLSLSQIPIIMPLSIGRIVAIIFVLGFSFLSGGATGAVCGVCYGIALDMHVAQVPIYAMTLSIAGLASGIVRRKGKFISAIIFILAAVGAVIWTWTVAPPVILLGEVLLGACLFLLIPKKAWRGAEILLSRGEENSPKALQHAHARQRLDQTADALRSLCKGLLSTISPPQNDADVAVIFDRAALRVCKRCSLCAKCWQRDYIKTFNALNDATGAMLARGRSEKKDYPSHFLNTCIHFPAFLDAVNKEYTALTYRRQYTTRIKESRVGVIRQYQQISALLGDLSVELGQEIYPASAEQRRLKQFFLSHGLQVQVQAYRDHAQHFHARICGKGALDACTPADELVRALGIPVRVKQMYDGVSLSQQEPFMAAIGMATRKKDGETVCGDAGAYFKRDDGKVFLLLCDGMGSGQGAQEESNLAITLLQQFLQTGISAPQALSTLSYALALRGEETGGFTTIDLLELDLFTATARFYKLGSAPTYIKKDNKVQRITGNSLPAGLSVEEFSPADQTTLSLSSGDWIILASDGVCPMGQDDMLMKTLSEFQDGHPSLLAREMMSLDQQGQDDKTVLAVQILRRKAPHEKDQQASMPLLAHSG